VTEARQAHDITIDAGAQHSSCNDRWRTDHADAARDSWQRTLAFFHRRLDIAAAMH
jgi:dienelactone hydrolase